MTIQTVSNEPAEIKKDADKTEKTAPDAKATEQKESPDSETGTTEEKEESKESESKDDGESDDSDGDKPKKKGGFQRRIDKLNARNAQALQELEYWRSLATKSAEQTPKEEPKKSDVNKAGEPDPDSYETVTEYYKAVARWEIANERNATRDAEEKNRVISEQDRLQKTHQERVKEYESKVEDFWDVVEQVGDIAPSAAIQQLILESDNGPEIMYLLASNRAEFERINKLSPLACARELGRFERSLSKPSEEKQETKQITKAPKPVAPVGKSSGAAVKSIDDSDISQREYERLRREQMKRA